MVAGLAPVFGKQANRPVLLEATQQTKHLAPLQPDQHTGVTDAQMTRLNPHSTSRRTPACSSTTPPPRCTSQDPKTRASVTSTLQRGVISILLLQEKGA